MVVFSILLMVVILFRQQGLMGRKELSWSMLEGWVRSLGRLGQNRKRS
jgi:hypothetical protein